MDYLKVGWIINAGWKIFRRLDTTYSFLIRKFRKDGLPEGWMDRKSSAGWKITQLMDESNLKMSKL